MLDEIESSLSPLDILGSLNDGVYVTDLARRIVFWSQSATRILGWESEDVVGYFCHDNIMAHMDRHGRAVCARDTCPLYRSMVTGKQSRTPIVLFARTKTGRRVPLQVTVSPIHNKEGKIIGAVESFRDLSQSMSDMQRAKVIQTQTMKGGTFRDNDILCTVHYAPRELVGGDFYAIERMGPGKCAIFLADVMGHGISSALYTMYLRSLWDEHHCHLDNPVQLMSAVNHRLRGLLGQDYAYATAVLCILDAPNEELLYVGAGHPAPFLFHADGSVDLLEPHSPPIGLEETNDFKMNRLDFEPGACLLAYTDGAIEAQNDVAGELGTRGFLNLLGRIDFPGSGVSHQSIEEELLRYSSSIHLDDDLTLIEMRRVTQ